MTIKQATEKGIITECEVTSHRCGEIVVNFYNTVDNRDDATAFDVFDPLGNKGIVELSELYKGFCKENSLPTNTVTTLVLTHVAETMEELAKIC